MMEIVIKISDYTYKHWKETKPMTSNIYVIDAIEGIRNGTPLPKCHGNLKDMDALYENTEIGHDEDGYACVTWKAINDAPTIIDWSDSK